MPKVDSIEIKQEPSILELESTFEKVGDKDSVKKGYEIFSSEIILNGVDREETGLDGGNYEDVVKGAIFGQIAICFGSVEGDSIVIPSSTVKPKEFDRYVASIVALRELVSINMDLVIEVLDKIKFPGSTKSELIAHIQKDAIPQAKDYKYNLYLKEASKEFGKKDDVSVNTKRGEVGKKVIGLTDELRDIVDRDIPVEEISRELGRQVEVAALSSAIDAYTVGLPEDEKIKFAKAMYDISSGKEDTAGEADSHSKFVEEVHQIFGFIRKRLSNDLTEAYPSDNRSNMRYIIQSMRGEMRSRGMVSTEGLNHHKMIGLMIAAYEQVDQNAQSVELSKSYATILNEGTDFEKKAAIQLLMPSGVNTEYLIGQAFIDGMKKVKEVVSTVSAEVQKASEVVGDDPVSIIERKVLVSEALQAVQLGIN